MIDHIPDPACALRPGCSGSWSPASWFGVNFAVAWSPPWSSWRGPRARSPATCSSAASGWPSGWWGWPWRDRLRCGAASPAAWRRRRWCCRYRRWFGWDLSSRSRTLPRRTFAQPPSGFHQPSVHNVSIVNFYFVIINEKTWTYSTYILATLPARLRDYRFFFANNCYNFLQTLYNLKLLLINFKYVYALCMDG